MLMTPHRYRATRAAVPLLAAGAVLLAAGCSSRDAGESDTAADAAVCEAGCADAAGGDAEVDEDAPALTCSPGVSQSFCPGPTTIMVCDDGGQRWVERYCGPGEYCLGGVCTDIPCSPGIVICSDPKTRSACLAEGAGGFDWTPIETCEGACKGGECVGACGFDPKRTSSDPCEDFVVRLTGRPDDACEEPGLLAVPSSAADRIAVFDLSVEPPQLLPGSPFATCGDPSRILVDRQSRVIVTCREDGRVNAHESDGALIWSTQLPGCLAVRGAVSGPDDRLFVGCTNTRNVHELDPSTGAVIDTVQTGVEIYGLAVDESGVYGVDFGNLVKIAVAGALHVAWLVSANGYGLAADGAGRVWLSEAPGLVAHSAEDGAVVETVSIPGPEDAVSRCNGVTVGLDGRVYTGCADTGDYVGVWDPDSEKVEVVELPPGRSHPRGVSVDREGYLYTINRFSGDVTRFDPVTRQPLTFGAGALVEPYGYSGDMTGLSACVFAGKTTWESPVIDFGDPETTWLEVRWRGTEPAGTSITVSFRLDGGSWVKILDGMSIDSKAQTLQLRAVLESSVPDAAPTLDEIAVFYRRH